MMGHRKNNRDQHFYSFRLENQMPNNHFIRKDDEEFGAASPVVPKFMSPEDPAASAYSISFVCIFLSIHTSRWKLWARLRAG